MKSKKSFLSSELVLNNIRRFWWVTVLYALALFFASSLVAIHCGSDELSKAGYNIGFGEIYAGSVAFLITVPVFIGTMIFRYMQNQRSMVVMHAMPYTRLRLYVNNIISGLILLLTPILLNTLLLTLIKVNNLGGAHFKDGIILEFFSISMLSAITLYIWTIFIGMFTGSSIAQIIFTYISNFLLAGIVGATQLLLTSILYGFVFSEDVLLNLLKISPISQAFLAFDSADMPFFMIADVIICVVGLILGYYIYKYRNLETAGDVISEKFVKPIFKYGVTICALLAGGVYLQELFIDAANIFTYLIFALIGYVIAEMLLRKSFKVWDAYKGFVVFSIAFIIIFFGLKADLFGYEGYVPNIEEIKSVSITWDADFSKTTVDSPGNGILYSKENINNVVNLHRNIIANKNMSTFAREYIPINYELVDGTIVRRLYAVPHQDSEKYDQDILLISSSEESIKSMNRLFKYSESDIYSLRIYNEVVNDEKKYVTIENKEEIKLLIEALREDALNQYSVTRTNYYSDFYRVEFTIDKEQSQNRVGEAATVEILKFSEIVSANSINTMKFIQERGYDKSLRNSENILSIEIYDEISENGKFIDSKEEIVGIMEKIYSALEEGYDDDGEILRVLIESVDGNTSWIRIPRNKAEILKMI